MTFFQRLKSVIAENQIMVVLLALILGLVFPAQLKWLNHYSTQLLVTVFFTSSLRLSLKEIIDYAKDWRMLLAVNAFMLVIIPLALFIPFSFISPDWALALLILGAMPTGMTIALIADYFGGKTSLALVITATTSLLAPLAIPFVFKIAVGRDVPIPVLSMFWSLFVSIVIPFIFAMLVKRAVPKFVVKHDTAFREISVICFGLLIAGIVADTSGDTLIALSARDVIIVLVATLWLGILILAAYEFVHWRTPSERITIALCLVYLNNTLALFVGDKFFRDQNVIPKLLLLLLVVNVLLPPLKLAAARIAKPKNVIAKGTLV